MVVVLLVGLWVLSYLRFDQIVHRVSTTNYVAVSTFRGQIAVGGSDDRSLATVFPRDWRHLSFSLLDWDEKQGSPFAVFPVPGPKSILPWPNFQRPFYIGPVGTTNYELMVPYWLLVLVSAAVGGCVWVRWRFSLRTFLIAMMLLAAGFGVMAVRFRS